MQELWFLFSPDGSGNPACAGFAGAGRLQRTAGKWFKKKPVALLLKKANPESASFVVIHTIGLMRVISS